MAKDKREKNSMLLPMWGVIAIIAGSLLIAGRTAVKTYDTGGVTRAYPQWCCSMDVTDDMRYVAINDDDEIIYCIDREDHNKVRYMLDKRDFRVEYARPEEICFDEEGSLYVYVVEQEENNRGDLSERILRFDREGNFSGEYIISEEPGAKEYKTRYGMKAHDGYVSYVEGNGDNYAIMTLDPKSRETVKVAEFPLEEYQAVSNAEYNGDSYLVMLNDGKTYKSGMNGERELLYQSDFRINCSDEDNLLADLFTQVNGTYYFLDKKFYDTIYAYRDGECKKAYTLTELLGWEENLEQTDYRGYHTMVVENSFSCLQSHQDILEFSSNANLFLVTGDGVEEIPASDEGLSLPLRYVIPAVYGKVALFLGVFLVAGGILLIVADMILHRFTVFSKMLISIIPFIIVAFSTLTMVIVKKVETIYFERADEEMAAVSSLMASGLDKELILELGDMDDITNGNVQKMRDQLKLLAEDRAGWSDSMSFDLLAYDSSQCNYLLATYPQREETYLNTYFLQTVSDLEATRVGGSNTYSKKTFNQSYRYVDAITVIYNEDNEPIALLDVYKYLDKMQDEIRSIQISIIRIAVLFTGVVIILLVVIAGYITGSLKRTSSVIKEISGGNLFARVEKISKDEVGVVAQGINDMADQLVQMFQNQAFFSRQVIETLVGTIDAKDKYTNGHSLRVAKYSKEIAKRLGKSRAEQENIYYAGLLHDIGKIGVPDEIINKTARLSEEEYAVIKRHPEIGHDLLKNLSQIENIDIGAYGHHERYDGKGYPQGLKGDEIPEIARIIGVADAYDAMTSNRSYRNAMSQEKVRSEIEKGKGSQFDPVFADIMLEVDEDIKTEIYG